VWRTSGCRSHFVLWESSVWWCTFGADRESDTWPEELDAELREEWRRIRSGRTKDDR
jgi:hypothetical protein